MACDVDTGAVFKHPVQCFGCDQAFYFTLRKIAKAEKLACPLCGSDINLTDEAYRSVVSSVKETIALIDQGSRSVQRTSIASPA
jgi:rRNA maturation endonuclease Nob1